jgi:hypothetical protein
VGCSLWIATISNAQTVRAVEEEHAGLCWDGGEKSNRAICGPNSCISVIESGISAVCDSQ